jgi:hypothetical protein
MITTSLSREQRRAVEKIAQEHVQPCYFCRSTVWRSPYATEPGTGAFTLVLRCASCGNGSRKMTLSTEEAERRLNLRHDRRHWLGQTEGSGRLGR